jgi:asparagine N-glycosylation enzyme membrane subunit Stt3
MDRYRTKITRITLLLVIAGFGVILRCLHLLNADRYYIVSPDSHFFHWQALRVLQDQWISSTWHGGLTYPLAYAARILGLVTGMEQADALALAGKILPPALGVAGVLVVYAGGSRMYGQRVGLWAAFTWVILSYSVFTQVSGYMDRDGLSMLLVTIGIFLFFFGRRWHLKVRGADIGWALAAAGVVVIGILLYLEWVWLGPAILLAVLGGFVIAEVLVDLVLRLAQTPTEDIWGANMMREFTRSLAAAVKASSWRPLALVVGLSLIMAAIYSGLPTVYRAISLGLSTAQAGEVAELQPLSATSLWAHGLLLVPLGVGLYIALNRHSRADMLWLACFATLFLSSVLFGNRLFLYVAPAFCVLAGVGLAAFFDFASASRAPLSTNVRVPALIFLTPRTVKIWGAVLLLTLIIVSSTFTAYRIGSSRMTSVDRGWQEALAYLKGNTPEDSIIMSWWDYGYWILDMADRRPVVDNGFYGWDAQRLEDVGLVYCTTDREEAVRILQKYGADYVVFSRKEVYQLPRITQYGLGDSYGDGISIPGEMQQSLYYTSLYGTFRQGEGLARVYPSPEDQSPEVVILGVV